ncbi:hypothetical protein ACFYYL_43380 [Actinomadura geliboluensis]|uniref:hypothetical protein n=1 Tax=Actinomadura geliboluensis TaxID=882440 RepID=UPI00367C913B
MLILLSSAATITALAVLPGPMPLLITVAVPADSTRVVSALRRATAVSGRRGYRRLRASWPPRHHRQRHRARCRRRDATGLGGQPALFGESDRKLSTLDWFPPVWIIAAMALGLGRAAPACTCCLHRVGHLAKAIHVHQNRELNAR